MHTNMALDGEGRIVTTTQMQMSIARGAQAMVIEQGSTFTETIDHQPIEATSRLLMAGFPTEQRLVFGDTGWELTTGSGGRSNTQAMAMPEVAWLTPAQAMLAAEAALARGDEVFEMTTFDLSAGTSPVTSTMTRQEVGEVEVFGRTVPATRWTVETDMMPGIEMEQWIDDRGQPVRQSVPLMPGMEIEVLLADRELALAEFDAPEVMANTLIHPDRKIENPRRLTRAVYEISGEGLNELDRDQVPTAGFQMVEWVDEDTMRITIDLSHQTPGPGLGEDLERYSAATNAPGPRRRGGRGAGCARPRRRGRT